MLFAAVPRVENARMSERFDTTAAARPEPAPPSRARRRWSWIGLAFCVLYLSNIDMGVIEALPDNLPFVGNLDEAGLTVLLVRCWRVVQGARSIQRAALP